MMHAPPPVPPPQQSPSRNVRLPVLLLIAILLLPAGAGLVAGDPPVQSPYFFDDFEGNIPWTHGGAYDSWQRGTPSDGPGYCHSTAHCWGTNLTGPYANGTNAFLQSPKIDLSGATFPQLQFWTYYDLFWGFIFQDTGYIEATLDGGVSWQQVGEPVAGRSSSSSWQLWVVDLTEFAGHGVSLRFRLVDESANPWGQNGAGWYIDDVTVLEGTGYQEVDVAISIDSISPEPPVGGQDAVIVVTVSNVGRTEASEMTVSLTIVGRNSNYFYQDSGSVAILEPSESMPLKFLWPVPKGEGVEYDIAVNVFPSGPDANPDNNFAVRTVMTQEKQVDYDMAVSSLVVQPQYADVGQSILFTAVIGNKGIQVAKDAKYTIQIIDASGIVVQIHQYDAMTLQPGERRDEQDKWSFDAAGDYRATATVTLQGDQRPKNDVRTVPFYVGVTPPPPPPPPQMADIAVTGLAVAPLTNDPAIVRKVTATVANLGDVITKFRLTLTVTDAVGTVVATDGTADALDRGAKNSYGFSWTPGKAGTYIVIVEADADPDSNAGNNKKSTVIILTPLVIDAGIDAIIVTPRSADKVARDIVAVFRNAGDSMAKISLNLRITDPSGAIVVSKNLTEELAPGSTMNESLSYTPTAHGGYTVSGTVQLDGDGNPVNDNRNVGFQSIDLSQSDLSVESLTVAPRLANPFTARNFTAVVANVGDTANSTIGRFTATNVSSNATIYTTDFLVDLAPGASQIFTVTCCAFPTGNYTGSFVLVNFTDDILTDNELSTPFEALPMAGVVDITVESIRVTPRTADLVDRSIAVVIASTAGSSVTVSLQYDILRPNKVTDSLVHGGITVPPGGRWTDTLPYTPALLGTYRVNLTMTPPPSDRSLADNAITTTFIAADLVRHDLSAERLVVDPASGPEDTIRTITGTVANIGDIPATAVTVSLQVRWGIAGLFMDNQTADLLVGSSKTFTWAPTFPDPGTYLVGLHVTHVSDEYIPNDWLNITADATELPKARDLLVTGAAADPNPGQVGAPMDLSAIVANAGGGTEQVTVTTDVTEVPSGKSIYSSSQLITLAPYASVDVHARDWIPTGPTDCRLTVSLSGPGGPLGDDNPANDKAVLDFEVRDKPVPPPPPPAGELTIEAPDRAASGSSFTVTVWMSRGDRRMLAEGVTVSLAASSALTAADGTAKLTAPVVTVVTPMTILASHPRGGKGERAITIDPAGPPASGDAAVTDIRAPSPVPSTLPEVLVVVTITNRGSLDVGAFSVAFTVRHNGTPTPIEQQSISGIAANGTKQLRVAVPLNGTGTYDVTARILLTDSDPSNNEKTGSFEVVEQAPYKIPKGSTTAESAASLLLPLIIICTLAAAIIGRRILGPPPVLPPTSPARR